MFRDTHVLLTVDYCTTQALLLSSPLCPPRQLFHPCQIGLHVHLSQAASLALYLHFYLELIRRHLLVECRNKGAQEPDGEKSRIRSVVDPDRGRRHASGHLNNAKQGIQAI